MQIRTKTRTILGSKVKAIRDESSIPCVVYGLGNPSIPLECSYIDFVKLYKQAGETTLIDLIIDENTTKKVLVKEIQKNPVSSKVSHVSFIEVNLKVKITANIPVEVIGEEESPILKSKEGVLNLILQEIEVEALPTDLPHKFEVNVSNLLNIGDEIKISNLEFDRNKVSLVNNDEEDLILNIDHPASEEAETEVSEAELIANLEVTSEKKPEDGEESEEEKSKK
jgi:large subunit ribosomal protein L25